MRHGYWPGLLRRAQMGQTRRQGAHQGPPENGPGPGWLHATYYGSRNG